VGLIQGQFLPVYVEPKNNPTVYDQEIFLATHEWEPFFTSEEEMEDEDITPDEKERKRTTG